SRGAHYRSDFPNPDDDKWKVNIYCRTEGNKIILFKQNVKEIRGSLIDLLKTILNLNIIENLNRLHLQSTNLKNNNKLI
ncbi:MAG TPA: hypothetical protein VFC05_09955, partial [Nitrososphaeraceae archaeon]|nr:hypothetical protein [Nitrososphaeraceae archaeon]